MVSTRRSTTEQRGISLRADASRRQQRRLESARSRRGAAAGDPSAAPGAGSGLPVVYREMLVEAGVSPASRRSRNVESSSEPPAKRLKRPGQKSDRPMQPEVMAIRASGFARAAPNNGERSDDGGRGDDDNEDGDMDDDEDDGVEFEDIVIPDPVVQTTERDSEDDDSEDDSDGDSDDEDGGGVRMVFEDVVAPAATALRSDGGDAGGGTSEDGKPEAQGMLELNLTAHESGVSAARRGVRPARKKPLTRAERLRRIDIHKVHVCCLMAHAARRNRWCNDEAVQEALQPLLTDKMLTYLNPDTTRLSQFGQTESLKNGLQQVATMFRARFAITERGLRRALWADDPDHLKDYQLPSDMESVLDREDFRAAANTLQGSRDVGAQLFCALLRTAGVETRLVSSLQPLSFLASAPTLPKPKSARSAATPTPKPSTGPTIPPIYRDTTPSAAPPTGSPSTASPLRRLGHPHAAAYHLPSVRTTPPRRQAAASSTDPPLSTVLVIRGESPFPVYWVEVLDVAHQKWQPVDALVTGTQWRPGKLEPPASDKANQLAYAIAFADDGTAKDVTRRYAKAYNAKTRRARVDGLGGAPPLPAAPGATARRDGGGSGGDKWLRRAMRPFVRRRAHRTDLDQIEDAELAAVEAREPLPRNVADFHNHPVFALERHLRRHEVLLPNAPVAGTVSAGSRGALERIYRRRDVRVAYSADRWYRLGRVVLPNEIPAKWLPPATRPRANRNRAHDDDDDDDDDDDSIDNIIRNGGHPPPAGTPLYTPEQTVLYEAPPVVDGRVPKNKFGNIDVYVPSMVPAGGVHVTDDGTARAAVLLGLDYAPALTGFRFEGRQGTAVLRGAVVATEHADAVRAVLAGLADLEAEAEAARRTRVALRTWAVLLRGLRIRARIQAAAADRGEDVADDNDDDNDDDADDNDTGNADDGAESAATPVDDDAKSDATEEYDMVMDDDDDDLGGGGSFPE
ncbi:DNA repair protein [Niveomyces insectorum RCEF 264]|uniref:DNA repair protein n=1 Tax=Niveomyces insectorum RCEF 264 TaxID=1081102 RepID=A0A167VP39_9HYPO|nr:DNA repair protein [Niveomyces insectorum RCEF 264]